MPARLIAGAVAVTLSACFLPGCTLQSDSVPPAGGGAAGGAGRSLGMALHASATPTGTQPMLVDVDANLTMSATPGDGVGVFTQYRSGGHWNVWWTCDTNETGHPCSFDVSVTVATGSITDAAGQALQGGDTLTQAGPRQIEVQTMTTTAIAGVTFDSLLPSGATPIITLDAKLGGVSDPSYLFFVQDRSVNGGYSGTLTDPLMLEPSSP
jgi:hypothetical protein